MPHRLPGRLLAAGALLTLCAGCGGEPAPLTALPPVVPEDLCALLPADRIEGLEAQSSGDESGDPSATCSLSSPDVSILVTWLQLEDDESASDVLATQCAAIPGTAGLRPRPVTVEGANEACAARGRVKGADRASLALASGREVVTVRVSARDDGGDQPDSLRRARALAKELLVELPAPR